MTMMLEMIVPWTVMIPCTDHLLSIILDIRKMMDLKLIVLSIKSTPIPAENRVCSVRASHHISVADRLLTAAAC